MKEWYDQRKMLRLIVETKRKYKMKTQISKNVKVKEGEKENHRSSDEETVEDSSSSSKTDYDQDNEVYFRNDVDEEIDTAEIEEEDGIEYTKRSTASERMKAVKIKFWMETHRRMKWRLTMRIASLPDERWTKKAAEWNPNLSI